MQVEQREVADVEAKLNRQHGLKAAVAIAVWSAPILAFWYWLYLLDDRFAPLMLAVSGALTGLLVRYYGRGYTLLFSVLAFLAHLLLVIAALMFGLSLGEGQSVRAFILVGLYAMGAWAAVYSGRVGVPFELHRAFYVLAEQASHHSSKRLRNRWFIVVPVAMALGTVTLSLTLVTLTGVEIFRTTASQQVMAQQQRDAFEAQAIDVTSLNLQTLSTEEAMRYAYAYFNGALPNKKGNRYSSYPKSEYKAKRILSFLIEERDNPRAKFVLGKLNYQDSGNTLIRQAAEQGDSFAKIAVATEFACYGEPDKAKTLLNMLARTVSEKSAQNEIYAVLNTDFAQVCEEFNSPDFALMYTRSD